MVEAKLNEKMKNYIKDNKSLTNRRIARDIELHSGIKVSHTIVGRYKRTLLEMPLETSLETSKEKLSREDRKKIFNYFDKCARSRFGSKKEREEILDIFIRGVL